MSWGVFVNLTEQGIRCKAIVSRCLHGKRILINDFEAGNPYLSCEPVATWRNDLLEHYLPGATAGDLC